MQRNKQNKKIEKKISSLDKKIADLQKQLKNYTNPNAVESLSKQKLASLDYTGKTVVNVNNNNPDFSKEDLDTRPDVKEKIKKFEEKRYAVQLEALKGEEREKAKLEEMQKIYIELM